MKSVGLSILALFVLGWSSAAAVSRPQPSRPVAAAASPRPTPPARPAPPASAGHHHSPRPGVIAVPYAYPVFIGGYGNYGYGSGYGYGYDNPAPPDQPDPPQTIVNQNFVPEHATPVIREYGDDSSSDGVRVYDAPGREPTAPAQDDVDYYLIAFKDHTIFSAFAYWVDGDTLHYVTAQRVHNQASLSLVDRELTARLNRNHGMQVKLPN